ncbi:Peroxisomal membrane protein pex16 [Allomyces javanicus]|nr:Peroxisomal membrane protein pex16 [Allomyces javanicus]
MSPLSVYREFLLQNAAQISSVESALRSLSYFLPGRFEDADLASEGLFAAINLLSLYHDRILYDAVRSAGIEHKSSLLNHYHHHWYQQSAVVLGASTALTLIQTVEGFIEMAANKRLSRKRKWDVVAAIEAVKVILRLVLVARTRRATLTPAGPERDIDPQLLGSAPLTVARDASGSTDEAGSSKLYRGTRTGVVFAPLEVLEGESVTRFLTSKSVRNAYKSPADLLAPMARSRTVGEVLFVLRPLIYVMLIRRFGRKSWIPFAASLVVEAISYLLAARNMSRTATPLEQDEHRRRAYLFLFYLLRSPLYDAVTKGVLDSFCASMANKPILRLFANIVQDYQPLWENVYFYTSGS